MSRCSSARVHAHPPERTPTVLTMQHALGPCGWPWVCARADLVFDGVRVTNPPANGAWGKKYYYCKGVSSGVAMGGTWPVPPCFRNQTAVHGH